MPLPLPNLDDRRFDDLVKELRARLLNQVPDLKQIAPGDPLHAVVDLFAWLTETILYRANRVPERQKLAFLNLLDLHPRASRPARGLVCVDARTWNEPVLRHQSAMAVGRVPFITVGEVHPTPLKLYVVAKRALDPTQLEARGISTFRLRELYPGLLKARSGAKPKGGPALDPDVAPFEPVVLRPALDRLATTQTVDAALYLACAVDIGKDKKTRADRAREARHQLAGRVLNLGLAPADPGDDAVAQQLPPRRLFWELAWWPDPLETPTNVTYLPLEVLGEDTSHGGRRPGVVRLQMPVNADLFKLPDEIDPLVAGTEDTPPESPVSSQEHLLFWIRLRPEFSPLELGWLGVNAVEVSGQGCEQDEALGLGTGNPDQVFALQHRDVDATQTFVEVEEGDGYMPWQLVDTFLDQPADAKIFRVAAREGHIQFGNGVQGSCPGKGRHIRAASYRHGGGSATNLPPGSIKTCAVGEGRLILRQELPTSGGDDGETVAAALQRIPACFTHRNRAVTLEDFCTLAIRVPGAPMARADALPGFYPGASLRAARPDVPGAVSVLVLPFAEPAVANVPRTNPGHLQEVYDHLAGRTLVGTELYVLSPQYRPISLGIALEVTDALTQAATFQAVERALVQHLWPLPPHGPRGQGWPLGRTVERNELLTQAARVEGVEAVHDVRLFAQDLDAGTWEEIPPNQHLTLEPYQLPALMAVALVPGEGTAAAPAGYGPPVPGEAPSDGSEGTPSRDPRKGRRRPIPIPVIPDFC